MRGSGGDAAERAGGRRRRRTSASSAANGSAPAPPPHALGNGSNPARTLGHAAEPLLDTLVHAGQRMERRRAFDELVELGPEIAEPTLRRLRDPDLPWYAKRNLLALLGEVDGWPVQWSLGPYVDHYHVAVRREALKILLDKPSRREWAMSKLLEERDRRSLALGLAAARADGPPPETVPLLEAVALDEEVPPELRAEAARALGESESPAALRALLDIARRDLEPAGLLRRRYRATRVLPETLAALKALRAWAAGDAEARRVLRRAGRCREPTVRRAALGARSA